ncbi:hypothetical protein AgCh_017078 [Apium graveolens]
MCTRNPSLKKKPRLCLLGFRNLIEGSSYLAAQAILLLSVDPVAFATSSNRGTIVDSGTTLTYLVAEAYDPFVDTSR